MVNTQISSLAVLLEQLDRAKNPDRLYPLIHPLLGMPSGTEMVRPIEKVKHTSHKKILTDAQTTEAWRLLNETLIPIKELCSNYGFSGMGPLVKRWEALGIYESNLHANALEARGITGYPIEKLREKGPQLPEFGSGGEMRVSVEELDSEMMSNV